MTRKNIPVFLKEGFVSNDFFRGACSANGDLFYDSWFNGNVNFDFGGDVGHVSFFKIFGGKNMVFEPVNMPQRNKILAFDCTQGGLIRRVKDLL
jgi:hypothetical protein